jgi:hypothetical protein
MIWWASSSVYFDLATVSLLRACVAVSAADAHFTALVSARPSDLDQPVRQQLYLRALRTRRAFPCIWATS